MMSGIDSSYLNIRHHYYQNIICSEVPHHYPLEHLKPLHLYFPHHTNPSNIPQINIALNNTWDEVNIKQLYLLIGHLLFQKSKQSILKHIEIHPDFIKWVENQVNWVWELSNVIDLNDLFKKVHPYFDFLYCDLIVNIHE